MRRILLAVATGLIFSMAAFAGSNDSQDIKSLSAKLWKAPRVSATSLKSQKDDLAIVYGGEDISRTLSSQSYTG